MKASRKFNIVFTTTLLIGVLLFAFVGATFAYFHIQKDVLGNFKIGLIDASWYNVDQIASEDTTYNLAGIDGELIRGDSAGCNVLSQDGQTAGNIRIVVATNSADLYIRIKPYAYVLDDEEEIDVTSYLTFRYIDGSDEYVFGDSSLWGQDSGWYYYKNALSASGGVLICNNVVLAGTYPTAYTGIDMYITFTFEALQVANSPVATVWGATAASILSAS